MLFYSYLLVSVLLSLVYVYLMQRYLYHWGKTAEWQPPENITFSTSVAILIPARNEEAQIEACLQSIINQQFPKSLQEIIVIDDHSTDATAAKVRSFADRGVRLLTLEDFVEEGEKINSFKKKAIEIGIQQTKGRLIVATDADCVVGEEWLSSLVAYYEQYRPKFIAAPVNFYRENSALTYFQSLDFVGMMGITAAGIRGQFMHMCNGANLAYERAAFDAVDGFAGINHLASGDDMLLLQKIAKKYPGQIGFVKSRRALVQTEGQASWASFLRQRIRWASKSADYTEWKVTAMLAAVFIFCINILVAIALIPWLGWSALVLFALQVLVKAAVDYRLLKSTATFFGRKDLLRYFWVSQVFHILYIVSVGFLANFKKKYQWKGRITQ